MKSVTRECRKLIHNKQIRKNVLSIYRYYDDEDEKEYFLINFKEDTVRSNYSDDYINHGTTAPITNKGAEHDINDWLEEIAYIEN